MNKTSLQSGQMRPEPDAFRARLCAHENLIGTFIKTPTQHTTEIFGDLGYDFVVLDAEHAPFDRAAIDIAVTGARAGRIAAIVRVFSSTPQDLLSVLDCGAQGVLVPHVLSVDKAKDVASACRYRGGKRGFSNSPRAGRYGGLGLWDHVAHGDSVTSVIAQIEDPEAIAIVDQIAKVEGIDALFIGRGDLTVAMGAASIDAPEIRQACATIFAAGKAANKPVMVFSGNAADMQAMKDMGATGFVMSSDQGLMRQAATRALSEFKSLC